MIEHAFFSLMLLFIHMTTKACALSLIHSRRTLAEISALGICTILGATECPAYTIPEGLGAKLMKRDPSMLRNRIFNVPPSAQIYPEWLRGAWQVTATFNGYLFPSKKITRERLVSNYVIPGFQKCSIAAVSDIGKDSVSYHWRVDIKSGLEDRGSNFKEAIDAYLGYSAVYQVLYDPQVNPNRISIDFIDYKTVNAERIELFCNARESESYLQEDGSPIFVCSEYIRQVTFGTGSTVGVPRQVVTNYAHFWTWEKGKDDNTVSGNLLTAAFLDPQDTMFFEEPTLPVVVYSHVLNAKRI